VAVDVADQSQHSEISSVYCEEEELSGERKISNKISGIYQINFEKDYG